MDRRQYLSASMTLLTVGVAGCSQSSGDTTPTDASTDTPSPTESTGTPADPSAQIQHEGDTFTLDNAPEAEIRGTTNLPTGTQISILIDSETPADPFVFRPETTVSDGGQFSTTVDLSERDEGIEFSLRVKYDDETLTETDGEVV